MKFKLGQVVMTPGVQEKFKDMSYLQKCLSRHAAGDWGDLDAEDVSANDRALVVGSRLLSSYISDEGILWIITEADRSVTTFLLPSEY